MAGQYLQGTTESMHQLGLRTKDAVETMTSQQRSMLTNMEATTGPGIWQGMGSGACSQTHFAWDGNNTSKVLVPGHQMGDNIITVTNLYDSTDLGVQSALNGIAAGINPTA
jgi:hypothetical protein